jgi:DNA-binding MltR family transcriptional regulator
VLFLERQRLRQMETFEEVMARVSTSVQALKKRRNAAVVVNDLLDSQKEFDSASDRAFVILWASRLDEYLRYALPHKLRPAISKGALDKLFEENGPLTTFSAKIILGYAVGLYGLKTFHDLEVIRQLRNEFAHSTKALTFSTKEVVAVCATLLFPEIHGAMRVPNDVLGNARKRGITTMFGTDARTRLAVTAHSISFNLVAAYEGGRLSPDAREKRIAAWLP